MIVDGRPGGFLYWFILGLIAILCAWSQFLFAYCARFEGGALESVRLSFMLMVMHPLKSLTVLLFVVLGIAAILIVPPLVFLLPSFICWLCSITIEQIFFKHMRPADQERTELERKEHTTRREA